jgi:hypothetical protein
MHYNKTATAPNLFTLLWLFFTGDLLHDFIKIGKMVFILHDKKRTARIFRVVASGCNSPEL